MVLALTKQTQRRVSKVGARTSWVLSPPPKKKKTAAAMGQHAILRVEKGVQGQMVDELLGYNNIIIFSGIR